jgi:TPP-dependent trihydroxycyclohexane-1,2-dione (THcHDO) dehydratase
LDVGAAIGDGQVAGARQARREEARQLVAVAAGSVPAHLDCLWFSDISKGLKWVSRPYRQ